MDAENNEGHQSAKTTTSQETETSWLLADCCWHLGKPARDWCEIGFTFITPGTLPQNWCRGDNVREILFSPIMRTNIGRYWFDNGYKKAERNESRTVRRVYGSCPDLL